MSVLDKIGKDGQDPVKGDFLIGEDSFGEEYPGVFEMLARRTYEGHSRRPGRLIMYAEADRATLVLCDVDAGKVTFYASSTFGEALEGLERALQAGTCDWRKDKRHRSAL